MAGVAPERVYVHWFRVTGRGQLPYRMLRLDRCWPRRQIDADTAADASTERREIQMEAERGARWKPTSSWWQEHGWVVTWHEPQYESGYRGSTKDAHAEPSPHKKGWRKRRPKEE